MAMSKIPWIPLNPGSLVVSEENLSAVVTSQSTWQTCGTSVAHLQCHTHVAGICGPCLPMHPSCFQEHGPWFSVCYSPQVHPHPFCSDLSKLFPEPATSHLEQTAGLHHDRQCPSPVAWLGQCIWGYRNTEGTFSYQSTSSLPLCSDKWSPSLATWTWQGETLLEQFRHCGLGCTVKSEHCKTTITRSISGPQFYRA